MAQCVPSPTPKRKKGRRKVCDGPSLGRKRPGRATRGGPRPQLVGLIYIAPHNLQGRRVRCDNLSEEPPRSTLRLCACYACLNLIQKPATHGCFIPQGTENRSGCDKHRHSMLHRTFFALFLCRCRTLLNGPAALSCPDADGISPSRREAGALRILKDPHEFSFPTIPVRLGCLCAPSR